MSAFVTKWIHIVTEWFIRVVFFLKLDSFVFSPRLLGPPSDLDIVHAYAKTSPLAGGLAGTVTRLHLDLVVKRPRANTAGARLHCRTTGQWREARFYKDRDTGGKLTGILPIVFETWYSPLFGDFVIVSERVDGDVLKWYLGNQRNVNGAPGRKRFFLNEADSKQTSDVLLGNLFECIAELHALYWNDRASLLRKTWLKGTEWYAGQGREGYNGMIAWAKSLFENGQQIRPKGLISDEVKTIINDALSSASFDALTEHLNDSRTPVALHHGDFHAGNIIVRAPGDSLEDYEASAATFALLDFSEVGVFDPMFDLCQILISDLEGSEYKRLCRPLIERWYRRIRELVNPSGEDDPLHNGFTMEFAYRSMLTAGVRRWVFLLAALSGFGEVSDEAIKYFAYNLDCWLELWKRDVPADQRRTLGFLKV